VKKLSSSNLQVVANADALALGRRGFRPAR